MKQWIASDIHADHKLMSYVQEDGTSMRPKDYMKTFMNSCKITKEEDVIYFLGDIAFGRQSYWMEQFKKIKGTKVLLKGNHDRNRESWYEKRCFDMVVPFTESLTICHDYGKILLTHIPALPRVLSTYDQRFTNLAFKFYKKLKTKEYVLNIHGHTHGKGAEGTDTFDASLECLDYCLTDIETIVDRKFK